MSIEDEFDSCRHHSATVDYGLVDDADGERVPVVRIVFHPGGGAAMADHPQLFLNPEALPELIEQLEHIRAGLEELERRGSH